MRLIERFAISYVPNAKVWIACAKRSFKPKSLFSPQHSRPGDSETLKTKLVEEIKQIGEIALDMSLQWVGRDKPADRLEQIFNGEIIADIIHLAVYGTFLDNDPLQSQLEIGGETGNHWISVEKLASSRLEAELVFLSGCDTGRVSILRDQEYLGMMSFILGQNVNGTILSFWPIIARSDVTIMIIQGFYDAWLKQGLRKDKACNLPFDHFSMIPTLMFGEVTVFLVLCHDMGFRIYLYFIQQPLCLYPLVPIFSWLDGGRLAALDGDFLVLYGLIPRDHQGC